MGSDKILLLARSFSSPWHCSNVSTSCICFQRRWLWSGRNGREDEGDICLPRLQTQTAVVMYMNTPRKTDAQFCLLPSWSFWLWNAQTQQEIWDCLVSYLSVRLRELPLHTAGNKRTFIENILLCLEELCHRLLWIEAFLTVKAFFRDCCSCC